MPGSLHPRHQFLDSTNLPPGKENAEIPAVKAHPPASLRRLGKLYTSSERPFHFTTQRVDWRTLHGIDLDVLARHQDTDALERCLQAGLANADLEGEDPATLTMTNVLRFTRLSQLALQYLVAVQDSWADEKLSLQAKVTAAEGESQEHKEALSRLTERLHKMHDQLQQAREEGRQLRDAAAQLAQDVEGSLRRQSRKQPRVHQQHQGSGPDPADGFAATVADLKQKIEDLRAGMKTSTSSQEEVGKLRQDLLQRDGQVQALEAALSAAKKAGEQEAEVMAAADARLKKLQHLLEDEKRASAADKENVQGILKRYGALEKQVEAMSGEIRRLHNRPADAANQGQIHHLKHMLAQLQSRLAQAESESQDKYNDLLEQYAQSEQMRKALAKEVKEMQKGRMAEKLELQAAMQKVQEHKEALIKEQEQAKARHQAEVDELWGRIDEGNERLATVKQDMQLARQDMDAAESDLDAYIARRPKSAVDRRL
ncbi:hypothetical protein WJX73_002672 [Symbiochloris irregularis]|uniref:Cilium assembly protein DZIP1 N-terminal domain-containing protein n=1 Tax=Symbiochloris irregularis TaxID=706552 RepID=A0AAW1PAB1_9CHLO